MTPGALILCGGRSRRMGRPKAWLPFGPEVLLQRVVRLVGQAAGPIVVVAAPDQDVPPLPDAVTIVRDPIADRGPLQGLAAGLAALPDSVELAYATATDVPFLAPAWIKRLHSLIGDADLAIPQIDGYHHPLAALYRRATVLPAITALLAADRLRPVFLIESTRARIVSADEMREIDPELKTLRNLNTPVDYRLALVEASSGIMESELHHLHNMERFQCPCCDYFTLEERGDWDICPVCYWEDDGRDLNRLDEPSGCNHGLTLRQGRENFRRLGASKPDMVQYVDPVEGRRLYRYAPRTDDSQPSGGLSG